MSDKTRDDRLWAELEGLRSLKRQSSIFDFEYEGDPPDNFTVTFTGRGIAGVQSDSDEAMISEAHEIQIQMAYLYPKREPDLKWVSPIYHPNVSNSGFVDLEDIGLEWNEELTIEIICERLWDVIRLAHLDFEKSSQMAAKDWFKNKLNLKLPIDARPLRDRSVATQSNVVQYTRRNQKKRDFHAPQQKDDDVLFIGDERPARRPPVNPGAARPGSAMPRPASPGQAAQPGSDDDILFID